MSKPVDAAQARSKALTRVLPSRLDCECVDCTEKRIAIDHAITIARLEQAEQMMKIMRDDQYLPAAWERLRFERDRLRRLAGREEGA